MDNSDRALIAALCRAVVDLSGHAERPPGEETTYDSLIASASARLSEPDTGAAVIAAARDVVRWRYDEPGRQPTLSMDTLRQCLALHDAARVKEGTT